MGLLANLAPVGRPGRPAAPLNSSHDGVRSEAQEEAPIASTSSAADNSHPPRGRLVRDENGNVVGCLLPEDEEKEREAEQWPPKPLSEEEPAALPVAAKTDLVLALEDYSRSNSGKAPRRLSTHQFKWLRSLVDAHGDDIGAMSRDLKRNVWQKTPRELRKLVSMAGGIDNVRSM